MAAPFVSGVAALLKAFQPELGFAALRSRILAGGDPIPALQGKVSSGRRLNALGALLNESPPNSLPPAERVPASITGVFGPEGRISLFRQAPFRLELSGSPGDTVSVSMILSNRRIGLRGDCSLGNLTLDEQGRATLEAAMLLTGAFKLARRAAFVAPGNRVQRNLGSLFRHSGRKTLRYQPRRSVLRSLSRTCSSIQASAFRSL